MLINKINKIMNLIPKMLFVKYNRETNKTAIVEPIFGMKFNIKIIMDDSV